MDAKKTFASTKTTFDTGSGTAHYYSLKKLDKMGFGPINKLPFTIRILLEAVLREYDDYVVTEKDIELLANYDARNPQGEIPFKPSRGAARFYRRARDC